MPAREEFQSINSIPLFKWLVENPAGVTWWLWGSIFLLALLTANTLLCSVESIVKKRQLKGWLLVISPQVIHLGFLFILLAHLLSSAGSFRGSAVAVEGSVLRLPNDILLQVKSITLDVSPQGYPVDWRTDIEYFKDGVKLKEDFLAPNKPSFYKGFGVYLKDIRFNAVLLEISREPGAPWALAGGLLFTAGTLVLVILKMKRES
jgi:hypothetical protein